MVEDGWLVVETQPSVSLGRKAGVRGRVRAQSDGLLIQLVDLRWIPLRRTPEEVNPREFIVRWSALEVAAVESDQGGAQLVLRAASPGALSELPTADSWGWSISVAPGQDLEAREAGAEIALRLAESR